MLKQRSDEYKAEFKQQLEKLRKEYRVPTRNKSVRRKPEESPY